MPNNSPCLITCLLMTGTPGAIASITDRPKPS